MKKEVIIDTSYLLPLFGISVDLTDVTDNILKNFWKYGLEQYNINISDISLLETIYKLNSDYRKSKKREILNRYEKILPTILSINFLRIIQSKIDPLIISYANIIRFSGHTNYFDCIIAATALRLDAHFITEDNTLRLLLGRLKEFDQLEIMSLAEFLR